MKLYSVVDQEGPTYVIAENFNHAINIWRTSSEFIEDTEEPEQVLKVADEFNLHIPQMGIDRNSSNA